VLALIRFVEAAMGILRMVRAGAHVVHGHMLNKCQIKLFAWEHSMRARIATAREAELTLLLRRRLLDLVSSVVKCAIFPPISIYALSAVGSYCIPLVHMLACYVVFTAVMKQSLSGAFVHNTEAGMSEHVPQRPSCSLLSLVWPYLECLPLPCVC
jgi:hypothetical protein